MQTYDKKKKMKSPKEFRAWVFWTQLDNRTTMGQGQQWGKDIVDSWMVCFSHSSIHDMSPSSSVVRKDSFRFPQAHNYS
jgi:hypothetical protein